MNDPLAARETGGASADGRLDSWKEIASHFKRAISTVQRWEKEEALPVHRHHHAKQGSVYAYRSELDAWWHERRPRIEAAATAWRWGRVGLAAGVGVLAVVLAVGFAGKGPRPAPSVRLVPLTSSPGLEEHPALSPDGRQLAFVWDGDQPGRSDVYVKPLGAAAVRLTNDSAPECCLAWSPDASSLAFVRVVGTEGVVMIVPAFGGAERRLATFSPWFGSSLSWSPDGRLLAYSDRAAPEGPHSVFLLSLDGLEKRRLTTPPAGVLGDAVPKFSPDGKMVAFARVPSSGDALTQARVYVVPVQGGEPRALTAEGNFIGDIDWSPDGAEVLFAAGRAGAVSLWRVGLDGREPTPVIPGRSPFRDVMFAEAATVVGHQYRFSVAARARRLALTLRSYDTNIWRVDLARGSVNDIPLIASTWTDESPQFSPDGLRIALASQRSGVPEVWTCDAKGSPCTQVTALGVHSGTPRWSPDGKRIAFDSRPGGQSDIYVVDVETLATRRVTEGAAEDVVPSWSKDGQSLYFASNRSGDWQVWRAPVRGGEAFRVTKDGGFAAFEADDSAAVYYSRFNQAGVWRVSPGGGEEVQVLDEPSCWGNWALAGDFFYFLEGSSGHPWELASVRIGGRDIRKVAALTRGAPCAESSLAIAPDQQSILYVGVEQGSDIVLLEDLPPSR